MSALLGTTGNSEDYKVYLEEIGAVMDSTDDVYAAQVYCPITDLDHADLAYEWMYADLPDYSNDMTGKLVQPLRLNRRYQRRCPQLMQLISTALD